ncbi:MAG TPA: hypothetical protein VLA33_00465 [Gemmatimonadota bacterium]|nr:hypothetical protein [Gemmatimonadota bacterium]
MSGSALRTRRPARLGPLAVFAVGTVVLLFVPAPVVAQAADAPCGSAEHRQFDFWLGEWKVTNPEGEVVGTNTITAVSGGCGLREQWEGAGGGVGESLNAYDRRTGSWHQTWVGGRALVLRLEGGLRDDAMVLEGELIQGDDVVLQRITWTPSPDGSVRQHWETSGDGGTSWTTAFDGTYRKVDRH